METEVVIRRFKNEDIDKVVDLIHATLKTASLEKVYEPSMLDLWKTYYSKKNILYCASSRHLYIAQLGEEIVGTAAVHVVDNKCYVSMVYTDTSKQGKGIGRKLMNTIDNDELCKEHDIIFLHAALSACKFYLKMGYHYVEECPQVIVDCGLHMVEMEKRIIQKI